MTDDDLPDIGDFYVCSNPKCNVGFCLQPPGANLPVPWHIVAGTKEEGMKKCGDFEYVGKCPMCEEGTCCNLRRKEKRSP